MMIDPSQRDRATPETDDRKLGGAGAAALVCLSLCIQGCAQGAPRSEPVAVQAEPAPGCAHGGFIVRWGADADGDGRVDDAESPSERTLCLEGAVAGGGALGAGAGSQAQAFGAAGRAGSVARGGDTGTAPSDTLLTSMTQFPSDERCSLGGAELVAGYDTNGDGELGVSEVELQRYACHLPPAPPVAPVDLTSNRSFNPTPYIPPQCYTKTTDDQGTVHNPCYSCHTLAPAPNYVRDPDLQLEYSFPAPARSNPWENLFVDRASEIAQASDDEILQYVRHDNYQSDGAIGLARILEDVPELWDSDGDGIWSGFIPDCRFDFDAQGFDRDPAGELTGWRAFAYAPFPGTFWPANGSTDDVLIRLAPEYREDEAGNADLGVYVLNLAIVEALTTRRDVEIQPTDEALFGVDLDHDGEFATAVTIAYDWAPLRGVTMSWVGRARLMQQQGKAPLAAGLFPLGTEFLHSVRYLDVRGGVATLAARMKELRYARKSSWLTYTDLEQATAEEKKGKHDFPDRLRTVTGDLERGVNTGRGWRLQAFIEDTEGELRPQTYEELGFCVGCHGGIGVTTDTIFSFPRKATGEPGTRGWYHWSQQSIKGFPEPLRASGRGEYAFYLEQNGAGDELRANDEIIARFLEPNGEPRAEEVRALRDDVSRLVLPSVERALQLDKAYRSIVREQSYTRGRDAMLTPAQNVHREVAPGETTGIEVAVSPAD